MESCDYENNDEDSSLEEAIYVVRSQADQSLQGPVSDSVVLPPADPKLEGVVITDRNQVIKYVNDDFTKVTGYDKNEVIGRGGGCRFLQGSSTDKQTLEIIRRCIAQNKECRVLLINYKKDGRPFWNELRVSPFFDSNSRLEGWVGTQTEVNPFKVNRSPAFYWTYTQPKLLLQPEAEESNNVTMDGKVDPASSPQARAWRAREMISFAAETLLPTDKGSFRVRAYKDSRDGSEPIAIIHGAIEGSSEVNMRVHDQCFTSEVLGSLKCDCRQQLDWAMNYIKEHTGIVIYLQQEGRGIGLANKIKAYSLQEKGLDTVDANRQLGFKDDTRTYEAVSAILQDLNIASVRLLTNNPRKVKELKEELGIIITDRVPVVTESNQHSVNYIQAKVARMGHQFSSS